MRTDSGHSEDMDNGCHTAQDHLEAFRDKTGSEADTSPVGIWAQWAGILVVPPWGIAFRGTLLAPKLGC